MEKKSKPRLTREEKREQRLKEFDAYMERLKKLPPEKLNGVTRWFLQNEGKWPLGTYDIKAAMK